MEEQQSDMAEQQSETPPNGSNPPSERSQAFESYQTVAETVGMLPSLRWKDNLIQAIAVAGFAGIGAIVGIVV